MARTRDDVVAVSLLLLMTAAVFAPVTAFVAGEDDYRSHLRAVGWLVQGQPFRDFVVDWPHCLFHVLTLWTYQLIPGITVIEAGIVVALAAYLAGALASYVLLSLLAGRAHGLRASLLLAALALALMLVAPVNLLTPDNRYLGYLVPHAYHNPTMVVLKPAALAVFYLACRFFDPRPLGRPLAWGLAAGVATILCVLAKPSYLMALAPALALAAAYARQARRPVHWRPLLFGILLPLTLVMGLQARLLSAKRGVLIAPLAVFHEWDRILDPATTEHLALKLLLSILFPLAVYLAWLPETRRTFHLNLAWLSFAVGAAYTYLLAEPPPDTGNGNFTWSAQITVFVLFVASTAFLLERARQPGARPLATTAGLALLSVLFGLHFVCGLQWYSLHTGWLPMRYIIAVW